MRSLALALLVACGHPASPDPVAPRAHPADDPSCPVLVPGTSVTVEDTTDGAAMVFVTTGDAANVRERAKVLALAHSRRQLGGEPSHGHELSDMIGTPSTADQADIERGARVTFKATKPDDVAALQSELRMHAQHLAGGTCEMAM